jgi:5-methylcytosine-specific restriction protein A
MTDAWWCSRCCVPHPLGQRCPAALRAKWRRQDAARPAWHKWYTTPTWRLLRAEVLHASPWCAACLSAGRYVPAAEVDHIVPHRGDWTLFTDRANLQPLCRTCHSRKTAAESGHTTEKADTRAPETARRPVDARGPVAAAAPGAEVA